MIVCHELAAWQAVTACRVVYSLRLKPLSVECHQRVAPQVCPQAAAARPLPGGVPLRCTARGPRPRPGRRFDGPMSCRRPGSIWPPVSNCFNASCGIVSSGATRSSTSSRPSTQRSNRRKLLSSWSNARPAGFRRRAGRWCPPTSPGNYLCWRNAVSNRIWPGRCLVLPPGSWSGARNSRPRTCGRILGFPTSRSRRWWRSRSAVAGAG